MFTSVLLLKLLQLVEMNLYTYDQNVTDLYTYIIELNKKENLKGCGIIIYSNRIQINSFYNFCLSLCMFALGKTY